MRLRTTSYGPKPVCNKGVININITEDMALNEPVEVENNEIATPAVEEQATEEAEPREPESTDEEPRSEETDSEDSGKKGYSARVRELNARAKRAEEERDSLAAKMAALTGGVSGQPDDLGFPAVEPDMPLVQPGEEIDAVELDRRLRARDQKVFQRTDALIQLRAKQNEAINRITSETQEVMRRYPELDPESVSFNKELSDAITEATEAHVKGAPYTASVSKFVDKMMRPYKGAVSREVGDMTKSVAKQVSEAALRPTTVRAKERSAAEKSLAELEAELGVLQA